MSARNATRLIVTVVPVAMAMIAAMLALATPELAPLGFFGRPLELLGWIVIGALAALHRPLAGSVRSPEATLRSTATLGLGAVVLPAVAWRLGALPAAVASIWIFAVAEIGRRLLGQRKDELRGRQLAVVSRAFLLFLVTLATASLDILWLADTGNLRRGLVAAVIFVALFCAAMFLEAWVLARRLHSRALPNRSLLIRQALPVLLDAGGWFIGVQLAAVALRTGWPTIWPWWLVFGLLTAEAARNAILRGRSDHRVGHFQKLQEAHERILAETAGMGEIAQQVLTECRNVLPVHWFQFVLGGTEAPQQSWAAGPDGLLVEGVPKPPPRPNMLPGIHRRVDWQMLEESLTGPGTDDDAIAHIRLWCDPRRIESGAESLFATLLPQMASSVQRAQLDREAKLDPLTGVPVRRVLESRMQQAYRRICEAGSSMAMIMCDIDFFKKVNDNHGHAAGDEALKLVASTLDAQRREKDLCCRYGGEEFTVLLEDTDGDSALRLAERLRQAIEALQFVYEDQPIPLTLSLGVAAFPELHIKTASELLLLADEALYEAKAQGRNRCLLNCGRGAYRAATASALSAAARPSTDADKLPA